MKTLIFFIAGLLLSACSSDLDFDQAKQLDIQPVFEGDILYFDLHDVNLTDQSGNFRNVIRDTVDFGIFEDGKVRDGFVKADIEVAYNNTFSRHFATTYYFIDDNDQAVESGQFDIAAADSNQTEITGDVIFTFDKTANPDFVNFRKIVLEIMVSPDTLPVENKTLHVQTKGTFYINLTLE